MAPNAARAFSSMWEGLVVSVSTQVTEGFARMYFNEKSDQEWQSNSLVHYGSGVFSSRRKYAPFMNGRLMMTGIPSSVAIGRMRSSACRSVIE